MRRSVQLDSVGCTDWQVIPVTTKRLPNIALFMLLVLLIIEFPEPLEDEGVEKQSREKDKPAMDFALNGNNGYYEDE